LSHLLLICCIVTAPKKKTSWCNTAFYLRDEEKLWKLSKMRSIDVLPSFKI
jgi:hypothetical protein